MTATIPDTMARRKKLDELEKAELPPKGKTAMVRIDAQLAWKVNVITATLGINAAELLSDFLREFVEEKYAEAAKIISSRLKED